jgi:dATP pyrophosphohydrolase
LAVVVSKYIECYVVYEEKSEFNFLLLKRDDKNKVYPGIWQIITGRIEEGEEAYKAAYREFTEETGLNAKQFFVIPRISQFYTYKTDRIHLIPIFLAISDSRNVIISDEHSEFKWLNREDAIETIYWKSQKENLELIYSCLTDDKLKKTMIEIENINISKLKNV